MKRHERLLSRARQSAGWCVVSLAGGSAAGIWSAVLAADDNSLWIAPLSVALGVVIAAISHGTNAVLLCLASLEEEHWDRERAIRPRL